MPRTYSTATTTHDHMAPPSDRSSSLACLAAVRESIFVGEGVHLPQEQLDVAITASPRFWMSDASAR